MALSLVHAPAMHPSGPVRPWSPGAQSVLAVLIFFLALAVGATGLAGRIPPANGAEEAPSAISLAL